MEAMAAKRDYYEVLGVARTAVRRRDCRRVSQAGDQVSSGQESRATTTPCAVSRKAPRPSKCSATRDKRARYDRYGHAGVDGRRRRTSIHRRQRIFQAFGDIFGDSVFGDIFGGGRRGGGRRVQRGGDVRCDMSLDLLEAARGCTKQVEFKRHQRCADCKAAGPQPGQQARDVPLLRRPGAGDPVHRHLSRANHVSGLPRRRQHDQRPLRHVPRRGRRAANGHARSQSFRPASTPDAPADDRRRRAEPQRRPAGRLLLLHHRPRASAVSPRRPESDLPAADHVYAGRVGRDGGSADAGRPRRAEDPGRHAAGRRVQAARPRHARPAAARQRRFAGAGGPRDPQEADRPRRKNCCASWPRKSTPTSARSARAFFEKLKEYFVPEDTASAEDEVTACCWRRH